MSNTFKFVGTLKVKGEEVKVSDNLTVREFIIEDREGMYPQEVKFQLLNTRTNLLDKVTLGAIVRVSFAISGRSKQNDDGTTVYYNNLNAYKIEQSKQQQPQPDPAFDDDLPF